jgi:hypothetical protein
LKYCKDNLEIKSKPKDTLLQVAKMLDLKVVEVYKLQALVKKLKEDIKSNSARQLETERHKRVLLKEVEKFNPNYQLQ